MNILAVDTAALTASVAVMHDNVVIYESNVTTSLTHSETLMPMIDNALKSVGFSVKDIDLYAVSNGPGSFTGIRIGVAAIKALAYSTGKKVCGVNTLFALAQNIFPSEGIKISPIMDARRSQVYNAVYSSKNGIITEEIPPRAISVEELCAEVKGPTCFVGDGTGVYHDKIKSLIPSFALFAPPNIRLQKAAGVAYAASLAKEDQYVFPEELEVVYLRKSQAERERENKERRS